MTHDIWVYIFVMWLVSYLIRALPLTLIRRQITNRFVRSFLYYVPYVTLAVMTFPAILYTPESEIAGALALAVGIVLSFFRQSLFKVASACCAVVFVAEFFLVR